MNFTFISDRRLWSTCWGLVISIILALPAVYAQSGQNLLVNPNAETGNINGWTDPDNAWGAAAEVTPHGGKYFFWPVRKQIENTTMYQDVPVSSIVIAGSGPLGAAESVLLYFHLSGWLCDWDQYPHDRATLGIEARSASGVALAYYQTEQRNPIWIYHAINAPLPAGTSVLRVSLIATRFVGSDNDAYFDDLSLTVDTKQAASVNVTSAGDSRAVKVGATLQLTAQTMGGVTGRIFSP